MPDTLKADKQDSIKSLSIKWTSFLFKNSTLVDIVLICFLWCLSIILVNPRGEFPLMDDWSYAICVKRLIEEQAFRPLGWTSIPLLAHALWGSLFCAVFGLSFVALRCSTLVMGLIGSIGFYLLLRNVQASRKLAIAGALTIAFNPIYFSMSFSFMSDVPFTALTILASLFYIKSLKQNSAIHACLGTGFAVAGTLCRQLGVFLPITFGVMAIIKKGFSINNLFKVVLPTLICFGSLILLRFYLNVHGWAPIEYNRPYLMLLQLRNPAYFLMDSLLGIDIALLYIGLFLSPLIAATRPAIRDNSPRTHRIAILVFTVFVAANLLGLFYTCKIMPLLSNVIQSYGIGPLLLFDTVFLRSPNGPGLSQWFWLTITLASFLCAGLVLVRLVLITPTFFAKGAWRENAKLCYPAFFILGSLIYFLPTASLYYDRYLLPLFPMVFMAMVPFEKQPTRLASSRFIFGTIVPLILIMAFSVMGTRDYLASQRTRWEALKTLVEKDRVPVTEIDGGFEFNGMCMYNPNYQPLDPDRSWWFTHNNTYMLTCGEVPGYEVFRRYEYPRLLPPGKGNILVLINRDYARNNKISP
jgi:4-amino-4-deoxy-L-arabinose transferase-like glycosyltransferase